MPAQKDLIYWQFYSCNRLYIFDKPEHEKWSSVFL